MYFEKLRIKEKRPKSKFREEMEERWAMGGERRLTNGRPGFDVESNSAGGYLCRAGERPWEDKYGMVHFR